VNLAGEHIDYHDLPVLPMAIRKQIVIAFRSRSDTSVCAISEEMSGVVNVQLNSPFTSGPPGYWGNYVRAAAQVAQTGNALQTGIDAFIASDLPMAAGLSSSSALLIALSLALLHANQIELDLSKLTALLAEGEQLVGTRGGGMDHVAILASRAGFATLIQSFDPLAIDYVPVPANWRFLVAHSLVSAEKSGAMRTEYNARREAGAQALQELGLASYREALTKKVENCAAALRDESERNAFLHVTTEARRVQDATEALRAADASRFGHILSASHASLRDRLGVSLPQIDLLVECTLAGGALGARLTGAGFGGCVVALCTSENVERVRTRLIETYYAQRAGFEPDKHLFIAEPSAGALSPEPSDNSYQH
jgi:galactokinase